MNQDTTDFLATLLFLADDPEYDRARPLERKTVHDFAEPFKAAAERFLDAFRAHLADKGYSRERLNDLERSFGGNVFLSLSGHGAGFFDDSEPDLAAIHQIVKAWAGGSRFEELETMLEVNEAGKIDLAILPEQLDALRAELFGVPEDTAPANCPTCGFGPHDARSVEMVNVVWDFLKRDPEGHKDRRATAYGSKTRCGLARVFESLSNANAEGRA